MAYIAPVHGASSIRHAIKLRLIHPRQDCLVVAKSNRLEVYTYGHEGISLEHTVAIWGRPVILEKLVFPPSSVSPGVTDTRHHLFVATDQHCYFTLSWDQDARQLRTEQKYVDVSDPSSRATQLGDRVLIDPARRFMTLEIYEGIITVIPIMTEKEVSRKRKHGAVITGAGSADSASAVSQPRVGDLGEPTQCRIEELLVRSSAFLHRENSAAPPRLALLYEDSRSNIYLKIRELKVIEKSAELQPLDIFPEPLDAGSSHIISVPSPIGGMLVLSESAITYMNDRTLHTVSRPLAEATVFTCWEKIDDRRWLLADDYSRLYFMMLSVSGDDGSVYDWKIDCLGTASHASVMVHLGGPYVFIGSHQGNSQVIKIVEKSFEVVQSFVNLAPILDFSVMNLGNRGEGQATYEFSSGQARIVTGSGAFLDGSLRSVRSGVGMRDIGIMTDMELVTDIWGLRCTPECPGHLMDTLVVSLIDETRVFRFSPKGEIEEKEMFLGLSMEQNTLHVANVPYDRVVQVTESKALVSLISNKVTPWAWTPQPNSVITAAATNDHYLVLVVDGRLLLTFELGRNIITGPTIRMFPETQQISGIALSAQFPNVCIVCHPQLAEVHALDLIGRRPVAKVSVGRPGNDMPRTAIIAQVLLDGPPTLFVAMADGCICSFSFHVTNFTLTKLSRIVISSEPASFRKIPRADGTCNIYAACEQPSMVYASEGQIIYSAVDAEPRTRLCHFDTAAFPGSVAVATPTTLKLAAVDSERTTQVRTLPLGETVYRTTYSSNEHAFGLGTIKRELQDGAEVVTSHFVLADEMLFRTLCTYDLKPDEMVASAVTFSLPLGHDAFGNDTAKDVFAVGTAYADGFETANCGGRILMFEVTDNRELDLLVEYPLKGACRALAAMEGNKLVAALIKSVAVFDIDVDRFGDLSLKKKATYRTSTVPTDIAVTGDIIAVADLMKSVSLVQYVPATTTKRDSLVEVARHYQTVWSTCVASVDENIWLEADAESNLVILGRNSAGATEGDAKRMTVLGEVHLGEMVNAIKPVNIRGGSNAVMIPRAYLATVDGGIYLFGLVHPQYQDFLMRLQAVMSNTITTPGNISFNAYRGFRNQVRQSDEPYRFIDGELVERFLVLPEPTQQSIVDSLNTTAELAKTETTSVTRVKEILEELKRKH